jgi:putative ABC transport system ATP-binding protein
MAQGLLSPSVEQSDHGDSRAVALVEVTKSYGTGASVRRVLGPLSLEIGRGRFVAIMGASGSGKSTLLHMMGGLIRPSSGDVLVAGQQLGELGDNQLSDLRRDQIGFVFQAFNLVGVLSVADNVALPAVIAGRSGDRGRPGELLALVGLEALAGSRPEELSGGEQQRVAVARALMLEPPILLADEPTGNLDSASGAQVLELFGRLHATAGQTVILVTHDPGVAAAAEEVVLLRDGTVADRLVLPVGREAGGAQPVLAAPDREARRRMVVAWLESFPAAGNTAGLTERP